MMDKVHLYRYNITCKEDLPSKIANIVFCFIDPTIQTIIPTVTPTKNPIKQPTKLPSKLPSLNPSYSPSLFPTLITNNPSLATNFFFVCV